MNETPQSPQALERWLENELAHVLGDSTVLEAQLTTSEGEQTAVGCHPNHHKFALGGVLAGAGLRVADIALVHWWLTQPWTEALSLIRDDASPQQPAYLLRRLSQLSFLRPSAAVHGMEYLHDHGLLVDGRLPENWLREGGKFGLGLPLAKAGLRAEDRHAFAGLWTIGFEALADLMSAIAASKQDRLVDLLRPLLDAHHDRLASRGKQSTYLRARARYLANCESFAAYDGQDQLKRWRDLPPTSGQGFLATATARALSVDQPDFLTRGDAADWLFKHGANLRFNKREGHT
ncbi:hypothetical protein M2341_000058 [Sphingobium sp. B7D2B]|uniref:hypothetical protein n=1 Tax=Sphingobium sp. B7D2B TaxID=2940583 RepID=UPI0022241257|nr:hypothetical protein [Sphingobium sp. B7D2B]MCW2364611.1 hypothetical protein [Sphingobium sp. B7D2B]